jgi:hypothetical protein
MIGTIEPGTIFLASPTVSIPRKSEEELPTVMFTRSQSIECTTAVAERVTRLLVIFFVAFWS